MGDCDNYKKHISDYLEGTLDKTTRKEFEKALKNSDELSNLTARMGEVTVLLGKLPTHTCSSDFNVTLHKKIHLENTRASLPMAPLKKYSYAFSFVVLAAVIVFSFSLFENDSENTINLPEATSVQKSDQQPAVKIPAQTASSSQTEVDIKTVDEQKTVSDSAKSRENNTSEQNIQYIDKKQK